MMTPESNPVNVNTKFNDFFSTIVKKKKKDYYKNLSGMVELIIEKSCDLILWHIHSCAQNQKLRERALFFL